MQIKEMVRLIADEGKLLTDGTNTAAVVDVYPTANADKWSEIDDPDYNPDDTPEETIE